MKSECARQILDSLDLEAMRQELAYYAAWYNEHRPSRALDGRTPEEVYEDAQPANELPRFEPRREWPLRSPCAAPLAKAKEERGARFTLVLKLMEGRKHLSVVELQRAT
jgi:hypothetical protein